MRRDKHGIAIAEKPVLFVNGLLISGHCVFITGKGRQDMFNRLADWALQYRQRVTWSEAHNAKMTGMEEQFGVLIGYWNEEDAEGKDPAILPDRNRTV